MFNFPKRLLGAYDLRIKTNVICTLVEQNTYYNIHHSIINIPTY